MKQETRSQRLKSLIGKKLFLKVISDPLIGGRVISLPAKDTAERDVKIIKDYEELINKGIKPLDAKRQIALKYKICMERVRQIVKENNLKKELDKFVV